MKKKLNLTIDTELIAKAKKASRAQGVSFSNLVEQLLRQYLINSDSHESWLEDYYKKFRIREVTSGLTDDDISTALDQRLKKHS